MNVKLFTRNPSQFAQRVLLASAVSVFCLTLCFAFSPISNAENVPPHATADRSGEVPAGNAHACSLVADLGSVHVLPLPPGEAGKVRYTVHLETDAHQPLAQMLFDHYMLNVRNEPGTVSIRGLLPKMHSPAARSAQFWVQYTVYVPANFSVEVHTGAGDIETGDIGGRALLVTEGGNISTGRIGTSNRGAASNGPLAKVETQGGHITILDVDGDLDAYTAGGFIQARDIAGNAKLRTGGGHIRAARINGTAQLETDGGNITVGEAGTLAGVRTGGGQIDFGEVHGSVHAETGGGGVRVMYVSGPMEVETSGGGICLTRVSNSVRAATGNGTITAWITPDAGDSSHTVHLAGPSQLASGSGDIIVFLPRNLAATIDANVENGGPDRIEADPALGLSVERHEAGSMHASGMLNGGGALLKLRSSAGKIRLQYVDEQTALRKSLQDEQRQRLAQKLSEAGFDEIMPTMSAAATQKSTASCDAANDWWMAWKERLYSLMGGERQDPEEFKKHLISSPPPDYPDMARNAGIQGVVRLQVRTKSDGTLEIERVLEGEPALVEAATSAVRQWRVNPQDFCGKRDVITTLAFNFQLR